MKGKSTTISKGHPFNCSLQLLPLKVVWHLKTGSAGRLVTFPPEGEEDLLHARKVRAARDGGANGFRFCISRLRLRVEGEAGPVTLSV